MNLLDAEENPSETEKAMLLHCSPDPTVPSSRKHSKKKTASEMLPRCPPSARGMKSTFRSDVSVGPAEHTKSLTGRGHPIHTSMTSSRREDMKDVPTVSTTKRISSLPPHGPLLQKEVQPMGVVMGCPARASVPVTPYLPSPASFSFPAFRSPGQHTVRSRVHPCPSLLPRVGGTGMEKEPKKQSPSTIAEDHRRVTPLALASSSSLSPLVPIPTTFSLPSMGEDSRNCIPLIVSTVPSSLSHRGGSAGRTGREKREHSGGWGVSACSLMSSVVPPLSGLSSVESASGGWPSFAGSLLSGSPATATARSTKGGKKTRGVKNTTAHENGVVVDAGGGPSARYTCRYCVACHSTLPSPPPFPLTARSSVNTGWEPSSSFVSLSYRDRARCACQKSGAGRRHCVPCRFASSSSSCLEDGDSCDSSVLLVPPTTLPTERKIPINRTSRSPVREASLGSSVSFSPSVFPFGASSRRQGSAHPSPPAAPQRWVDLVHVSSRWISDAPSMNTSHSNYRESGEREMPRLLRRSSSSMWSSTPVLLADPPRPTTHQKKMEHRDGTRDRLAPHEENKGPTTSLSVPKTTPRASLSSPVVHGAGVASGRERKPKTNENTKGRHKGEAITKSGKMRILRKGEKGKGVDASDGTPRATLSASVSDPVSTVAYQKGMSHDPHTPAMAARRAKRPPPDGKPRAKEGHTSPPTTAAKTALDKEIPVPPCALLSPSLLASPLTPGQAMSHRTEKIQSKRVQEKKEPLPAKAAVKKSHRSVNVPVSSADSPPLVKKKEKTNKQTKKVVAVEAPLLCSPRSCSSHETTTAVKTRETVIMRPEEKVWPSPSIHNAAPTLEALACQRGSEENENEVADDEAEGRATVSSAVTMGSSGLTTEVRYSDVTTLFAEEEEGMLKGDAVQPSLLLLPEEESTEKWDTIGEWGNSRWTSMARPSSSSSPSSSSAIASSLSSALLKAKRVVCVPSSVSTRPPEGSHGHPSIRSRHGSRGSEDHGSDRGRKTPCSLSAAEFQEEKPEDCPASVEREESHRSEENTRDVEHITDMDVLPCPLLSILTEKHEEEAVHEREDPQEYEMHESTSLATPHRHLSSRSLDEPLHSQRCKSSQRNSSASHWPPAPASTRNTTQQREKTTQEDKETEKNEAAQDHAKVHPWSTSIVFLYALQHLAHTILVEWEKGSGGTTRKSLWCSDAYGSPSVLDKRGKGHPTAHRHERGHTSPQEGTVEHDPISTWAARFVAQLQLVQRHRSSCTAYPFLGETSSLSTTEKEDKEDEEKRWKTTIPYGDDSSTIPTITAPAVTTTSTPSRTLMSGLWEHNPVDVLLHAIVETCTTQLRSLPSLSCSTSLEEKKWGHEAMPAQHRTKVFHLVCELHAALRDAVHAEWMSLTSSSTDLHSSQGSITGRSPVERNVEERWEKEKWLTVERMMMESLAVALGVAAVVPKIEEEEKGTTSSSAANAGRSIGREEESECQPSFLPRIPLPPSSSFAASPLLSCSSALFPQQEWRTVEQSFPCYPCGTTSTCGGEISKASAGEAVTSFLEVQKEKAVPEGHDLPRRAWSLRSPSFAVQDRDALPHALPNGDASIPCSSVPLAHYLHQRLWLALLCPSSSSSGATLECGNPIAVEVDASFATRTTTGALDPADPHEARATVSSRATPCEDAASPSSSPVATSSAPTRDPRGTEGIDAAILHLPPPVSEVELPLFLWCHVFLSSLEVFTRKWDAVAVETVKNAMTTLGKAGPQKKREAWKEKEEPPTAEETRRRGRSRDPSSSRSSSPSPSVCMATTTTSSSPHYTSLFQMTAEEKMQEEHHTMQLASLLCTRPPPPLRLSEWLHERLNETTWFIWYVREAFPLALLAHLLLTVAVRPHQPESEETKEKGEKEEAGPDMV